MVVFVEAGSASCEFANVIRSTPADTIHRRPPDSHRRSIQATNVDAKKESNVEQHGSIRSADLSEIQARSLKARF